jgi:hypothetical protein
MRTLETEDRLKRDPRLPRCSPGLVRGGVEGRDVAREDDPEGGRDACLEVLGLNSFSGTPSMLGRRDKDRSGWKERRLGAPDTDGDRPMDRPGTFYI